MCLYIYIYLFTYVYEYTYIYATNDVGLSLKGKSTPDTCSLGTPILRQTQMRGWVIDGEIKRTVLGLQTRSNKYTYNFTYTYTYTHIHIHIHTL